jgi:hypothetical protein
MEADLEKSLKILSRTTLLTSYLTAAPSGLIYVLDGSDYKLGVDGSSQVLAEQALASGNQALTEVEPAFCFWC